MTCGARRRRSRRLSSRCRRRTSTLCRCRGRSWQRCRGGAGRLVWKGGGGKSLVPGEEVEELQVRAGLQACPSWERVGTGPPRTSGCRHWGARQARRQPPWGAETQAARPVLRVLLCACAPLSGRAAQRGGARGARQRHAGRGGHERRRHGRRAAAHLARGRRAALQGADGVRARDLQHHLLPASCHLLHCAPARVALRADTSASQAEAGARRELTRRGPACAAGAQLREREDEVAELRKAAQAGEARSAAVAELQGQLRAAEAAAQAAQTVSRVAATQLLLFERAASAAH